MNCKMCGGVTLADRTIRTRSDGTCTCDDLWFDDQPNLNCTRKKLYFLLKLKKLKCF